MSLSTKDTYVKHSLGRYLLFLILLLSSLGAEDFSFNTRVDVPHPFVKEPVLLSVDLNQTNHDIVLLFNFDIKPSPDYTFRRLDAKTTDRYHNTRVHYLYLIYPLKSGDVTIHFDLTKKVTNDESVKESFAGDRDTVKFLETKDSKADVPPLTLHVKPLPKGTQLVGNFTLTHEIGHTHAKAYEPISFRVTISGEGYPPLLQKLVRENKTFTLFAEKPMVKTYLTKDGVQKSTVVYPMALSAKEDFTVPKIKIKAFDPKKERSYMLSVPEIRFTIEQPDVNTLVDKVNTPKPYSTDWEWLTNLVGYLIVFGAGFASGWLFRWQRKQHRDNTHPLIEKIEACKDKKALLQLLMAHDTTMFTPVITMLETDLYGKGTIPLKSLKLKAKELLDAH